MGLPKRIMSKIDQQEDCWVWQASTDGCGYGHVWHEGKLKRAHKLLYETLVGAVPEGLELDHLCKNRACVNPEHLEPVTHAENVNRGEWALANRPVPRTCKRGHPVDNENVYILNEKGWGTCLTCKRDRDREYARRYRAARKIGG